MIEEQSHSPISEIFQIILLPSFLSRVQYLLQDKEKIE